VLSLGGLRALVIGLAESFGDAGLAGRTLDARAFALGAVQLTADAFATAFGVALPLIVSAWLLDLSVALIARVLALGSPASAVSALRPLLLLLAAALLLVPIASRAPELVRAAILAARALTRAFAR
jgi:flagellar biosynthesis protein FliR